MRRNDEKCKVVVGAEVARKTGAEKAPICVDTQAKNLGGLANVT